MGRKETVGHGRQGESNMGTHTLPYVKQTANGNLLYDSRTSTGLCDNLDVWGGEEGGREVQEGGDIGMPMADSR